jgi:PAS domain S-box-containing protein
VLSFPERINFHPGDLHYANPTKKSMGHGTMVSKPTFSLDWAPDAIIVAGLDRTIAHLNPRAEDLFGYRRAELAERPLELLIPEGLPNAIEDAPLQQATRKVVCAHRDGTRFQAAARWRPARVGDSALVVFSVRETGADAAGEPADGIDAAWLTLFTHDVRQYLQAIQFLCDSAAEHVPDDARTISQIVHSIGKLLDRLTRFGEPGAFAPEPARCPLRTLLESLGLELSPLAERKGLRLVIEETDEVITTDPVLFRELLHNLLANAIRFTDAGHVEIRCRPTARLVRIEIADTGAVIDGGAIDAILTSASPAAHAGPGGLGLTLVRRLAQVLSCTIEVESEPGQGSCFSVIAPRRTRSSARRRGASASRSSRRR